MNIKTHLQQFDSIAANLEQLEAIRKLLEVTTALCANICDFSIIHWQSPNEAVPEEASYILIKQYAEDGGFLCDEAAYENEQFWSLFPSSDVPLALSTIAAWSYFPYDSRVNFQADM